MQVCTGSTAMRSLVQTVDFFTPIVDDPFCVRPDRRRQRDERRLRDGRTSADRARDRRLSERGDRSILSTIFKGGLDKLAEAGVALLGGHTVQDTEIKFGYAITGEVLTSRIWSNAGAQPATCSS